MSDNEVDILMKVVAHQRKDSDILEKLALSTPETWQQMYQQYYMRTEKWIVSRGGSKDLAMDIFQEGLMVLYQKARDPAFKLHGALYTYLFAVCRNLWRDAMKKKSRSEVTLADDNPSIDEYNVEAAIHEKRRREIFQHKFDLLSADCQKLLKMFFDGIKMAEIAVVFQTSEGYIRKKKFKCKERLAELVRADPIFKELI